ncbi:beach-domain-containing protein [Schizophyllum fasciatum]
MLNAILTPLRTSFNLSPRAEAHPVPPSPRDDEQDPEAFARDVMIELMRNAVEDLKLAEERKTRMKIMSEILQMMRQNDITKEVFRELDGFLMLVNVLATLSAVEESVIVEPEEQVADETRESLRLVCSVLSEAQADFPDNVKFFEESVTYSALSEAMKPLVADSRTSRTCMGCLFSLALEDFSYVSAFAQSDGKDADPSLSIIRRPGALRVFWEFIPLFAAGNAEVRCELFSYIERLLHVTHRNHAILCSLELAGDALGYFATAEPASVEKAVLQKLLRRLLDMGGTASVARGIMRRVVKDDGNLDSDMLEILRAGARSKWPQHFSMAAFSRLLIPQSDARGLPPNGVSFMTWLWFERYPDGTMHTLFSVTLGSRKPLALRLRPDGRLQVDCDGNNTILAKSKLPKARWVHVALVHYPHRRTNPSVRLFVDGVLTDSANNMYPRPESKARTLKYCIGSKGKESKLNWCLASATLLSQPLSDDVPRLVRSLGPRYAGKFQDSALARFLTYEASTSLNVHIFNTPTSGTEMVKLLKGGLEIPLSAFVFHVAAEHQLYAAGSIAAHGYQIEGDVFLVKASTLDSAVWSLGGAAVALRLLQLAQTSHELSRSLSITADILRNHWGNSEDMERLRGYEVLADVLRHKTQLINLTGFEIVFEAMGLNFRVPEQSTVTNTTAYRAIALDFELWAHTRAEIQRAYLEHFVTLLDVSKYQRFNARHRLSKLGLVRRMLFVLQLDWFSPDIIPSLVDALRVTARNHFSKEDAIKPMVSYLAVSLHESQGAASPMSMSSRIDYKDRRWKAELVFDALVEILAIPECYSRFTSALPITRICLLLLGERPTPRTALDVLRIISLSLKKSITFIRKFELISGWSVLKSALPVAWDADVAEAAFNIALGRDWRSAETQTQTEQQIVCPNIVPAILSALQDGLVNMAGAAQLSPDNSEAAVSCTPEKEMETLVERLIGLHSQCATFRQVFKSQQTTQIVVEAYKRFVEKLSNASTIAPVTIRVLEKMAHLGMALALDNLVSGVQKQEILETLQKAELIVNPSQETTSIDPQLIVDQRSVRQRIASARFSMQVGERTVLKTLSRIAEWRRTIQLSETKRLRKGLLDLREDRRQATSLYDWVHILTSERGLWPEHRTRHWRLDETEGPHRVRKKLEPQAEKNLSRVEYTTDVRDVQIPDGASDLAITEAPPWADQYEMSATEMSDQLADEVSDDKHRRVRHELEPGDVIEAVATVARVAGVDSSPGLIILGRTHIYMLDGIVENDDGEIIDARDAPKRLLFVPGTTVELDGPQKAQRWPHDQIATFSNKMFLFRDVALELYFKDSRSLLIVFVDKRRRTDINDRLSHITGTSSVANAPTTPALLRTPLYGLSKAFAGFRADELATAQRRWQAREISNFTYLSILNQISGRTPSDATQYPVFPWVLQDYTSEILDLSLPASFRDLTKPMGALTDARREAAESRYSSLLSVGEPPFHYGTHFSSSMIVCHFMIRLAPFTSMFKTLQGGDWDLPDRLFSDIARAYHSAAVDVRGDVRELIPEFFVCPEFLENTDNHDFGVHSNTGERVHHVKLPPWAHKDPLLFITLNRRALESPLVSQHLPAWIDLIWGCKQRDREAFNVFHPLSYEGSIDLDAITDELEQQATVGIIHNFGQTPRKLFHTPHPERYTHGFSTLPIGTLHGIEEDPYLLQQESRGLKALPPNVPVRDLCIDMISESVLPCPDGWLYVPLHPSEQIQWGPYNTGGDLHYRVVQTIESASCTCATWVDSSTLATGGFDFAVRLWRVARDKHHEGNLTRLRLTHVMRMHTERVVAVAASKAWSIVASGSSDASVAFWDLNRGSYVRSIWHPDSSSVHLIAINDSTGHVASCSEALLRLDTVNGRPIAQLDLRSYSPMTSLAFHEREYSHLGILASGHVDGSIALRTWTADGTHEGESAHWEFLDVRSMKVRAADTKDGRPPAVTALKFLGESLCHGEASGQSYMWTFPE